MFLFINNSDNNTKINNTRQQVHFVHAYIQLKSSQDLQYAYGYFWGVFL